jgi:hypothetical protein
MIATMRAGWRGRGETMMAATCSEGIGGTALVTCLSRQWRSRRAKAAWPPRALPTGRGVGNQSLLLHPTCRHHGMRGEMVAAAATATATSHDNTHLIMQTLNHVLCGGLADDEHKP